MLGLGSRRTVLGNFYLQRLSGYRAAPKDANIFDYTFMFDPELSALAQAHAADHDLFVRDFASAWTRLMNADRFEIDCDDLRNTVMIDVPSPNVEL